MVIKIIYKNQLNIKIIYKIISKTLVVLNTYIMNNKIKINFYIVN